MEVLGVVLEVVSGDDELTCSRAPNDDDDVIAIVFCRCWQRGVGCERGRVEVLGR